MNKIYLDWNVGFSKTRNKAPAKRVPAAVPGAVQLDWGLAEGYKPYTYADNYKEYQWMEQVYWSYNAKLNIPKIKNGEKIFFISKGIDYQFEIRLGDDLIYEQEGMFTPVEIDLTGKVSSGDIIEVLIYPAPIREGVPFGRDQASQCCKPAVSYGWDFHPRLVPLGIWDETYVEIRNSIYIKETEVFYKLSDDFSIADLTIDVKLGEDCSSRIMWQLYDKMGRIILKQEKELNGSSNILFIDKLDYPELWWPNGQGDPVLYKSAVELFDMDGRLCDRLESRVGFRKVSLVMQEGEWDRKLDFPKGPNNPPITLEINGRRIFCKGSNWISPHIFPGAVNEDMYRKLVGMAKDAHMNILRSWGGAVVNKEAFYNICDENGIMVWQEFPLSCNNYEGTASYLAVLDRESRSIIKRLRRHPCHVIWCGGNELFNSWSGMTEQSLPLRLLNRNCFDMDPETPFLMTSPVMGMGHGNYTFRYETGEEVFQVMPKATCTAYTEFGVPGPASLGCLRSIIPEEELFPPEPGTAWEVHHAFGSWTETSWLFIDNIEYYFGPSASIDELIERGQILQSEGYKCIFEEARRQKPYCSMALNWCFDEPWSTAANNSIISWPHEPKPAYYAIKASCRPLLASARIPKFVWEQDEVFSAELWMLNDLPYAVEGGTVVASIIAEDRKINLLEWKYTHLKENVNIPGPILRYNLPRLETDRIILCLDVEGHPELSTKYTMIYRKKEKISAQGVKKLNA